MRPLNATNAVVLRQNDTPVRADLAKRFKEASQKRASIEDFFDEFINQFISEQTKRAYMRDMEFFFEFLKSGDVYIKHPTEIKAVHFQAYRDDLLEKQYAPATISRRLICIRSFVKWCVATRLMEYNPLDSVKLPKVSTVMPTLAFDDKEVVLMLKAPDLSTHKGRMHRLVMALLFQLGLRREELCNIKLKDMMTDRKHVVLKIVGKGGKERVLPLPKFVLDEIQSYLDGYYKETKRNLELDDYLIQTDERYKNFIPIDGATIYRMIGKYTKELKIDKRVSPHSCRATVISHLLDTAKASIRDVATFAGHSQITTTERYDKRRGDLDKSVAYAVDYFNETKEE